MSTKKDAAPPTPPEPSVETRLLEAEAEGYKVGYQDALDRTTQLMLGTPELAKNFCLALYHAAKSSDGVLYLSVVLKDNQVQAQTIPQIVAAFRESRKFNVSVTYPYRITKK